MPLDNPPSGQNSAVEYQVSAVPWLTSSFLPIAGAQSLDFPQVSQFVTVKNTGTGTLSFAFSANGLSASAGNFYPLTSSEMVTTVRIRCKNIFLTGSPQAPYTVLAGLTGIPSKFFPTLTASINVNVG